MLTAYPARRVLLLFTIALALAPVAQAGERFSLEAGVDFTTQYMFRGIFQEDQGFIGQPWVEAGVNLYSSDDAPINSIDFTVGLWNSIHDGPSTAAPGFSGDWYEADFYAGLTFGLPANFSFDVTYIRLGAPDLVGDDIFAQEWDFTVAYDDAELWNTDIPDFTGLQPYITVAVETDGASDGIGNGGDIYIELGIAPAFTLIEHDQYPVTLSIPLTLGFGDGYYEIATPTGIDDDAFGYFDAGLELSAPLAFMPAETGAWTLTVGMHVLALGDNTKAINDGDDPDVEVIGSVGISVAF
jgi:uncharacterized protein (TIGR02001 family)